MNRLIAFLLALTLQAPAYAFSTDLDDVKKQAKMELVDNCQQVMDDTDMTAKEKMEVLSDWVVEEGVRKAQLQAFLNEMIDGVNRAVMAFPPKLLDTIPPDIENDEIPEFLVLQLLNCKAMREAEDMVNPKTKAPVLHLSISLTEQESRSLSTVDKMINFLMSHEDRIFVQVQK